MKKSLLKFLLTLTLALSIGWVNGQIIISQYYEGASNNKWIEITNLGSSSVDLTSPQLYLCLYTNANADATDENTSISNTETLTGSIAAGASILYKNSSAVLPSYASGTSSSICNFNGDDLLILTNASGTGASGAWNNRIDIIGDGTSWGGDKSFVRKSSIGTPNTTYTPTEWDQYTNTDVDNATSGNTEYLGEHKYIEPNPNDNTSIVNSTGVAQPVAADIASTIDAPGEAVAVFQFNIADAGGGDGLPTEVTEITIKAGPNNTADWTSDIGGGYLYKEGTGALTITTEPDVQADQVTFYIDDTELDIADGGSQLVTLYVWLSTDVTDNAVVQCMVDADAHGFLSDIAGSGFAADFTTDVTGNDFTIDVTSTQLSFVTQPSNVIKDDVMVPAVEVAATDANGSIDADYTSDITLTYSGAFGTLSGTNPVAAVNGVATFSDLSIDNTARNVTLAANDGSFAEATSETFGVYNVVTVTPPYTRDFETGDINTDGWSTQLVTGTLNWTVAGSTNRYARMSNWSSGNEANETWLISPAIDLWDATTAIFGFFSAYDYTGSDIEVYISSDYTGSGAPTTGTWDPLTVTLPSTSGFTSFVYSGDIDISSYKGGDVYVAFKYTGTDSDGKTWEIDDISIITDPPVISNIATTPASPTSSDAVTISADINDNGSIASASLSWGLSTGDYSEGTITMSEGVAPNYIADATIPAQAEETTVYYLVSATDDDGITTTSDEQSYYIPRSNAHVTSGVYTVVDGTPGSITNIPNGTTLVEFETNITAPPGGSFEVYESDGTTEATDLATGYILTGLAEDGTTEADYTITVSDIVPDTDSDVSAPTTQVAAATVAVVDGDETTEAFEVFAFDINDAGTADGLPTYVRQIVLFYGSNMTLDLNSDDLTDGWFEIDGTKVEFESEPIIGNDSIAFTFTEGDITVADGESVNAVLKVVLDPNAADGNVIQFMIDADQHGFEVVGISSEFESTFAGGDIVGNNITIDVLATELNFSTEPSNVYVDTNIDPAVVVEAIDANGNIDTDYVTDITVTATGATLTSAVSGTPVAGVATFSAISFSDAGTGVTLTASSGTLTNATSATFDVHVEPEYDLFISEYIEGGTGNNKAIEIYNPNETAVDLSHYTIKQSYNGEGWGIRTSADSRYVLPLSGTLAAGEVYVISPSDATFTEIISNTDLALTYNGTPNGADGSNVASFNGNDAIGLFKNDVLIDVIGIELAANGAGPWNVGDTTEATANHTIMRKYGIITGNTDWAASAGTNYDNSEWIVFGQDYLSNIGLVSFQSPVISGITINPTTPTSADNVVVSATIADGDTETSNLTVGLFYGSAEGSETTEVTFAETATAGVFEGTIPASASNVYYKITASDGVLTASATGNYSITTGINNPDGIVSMNLFPNPSNGNFTLEMNTSKAGTFNVEIINIQGQVVYQRQITQDGFYRETIDISNNVKGIYYLRIMDGKEAKVSKLIIQ